MRSITRFSARGSRAVLAATLAFGAAAVPGGDSAVRNQTTVYASWAYDVANDTYLVGAATHVFFATVLSVSEGPPIVTTETEDPNSPVIDVSPQTLYEVRAVGDIKGDVSTLAYAPNSFPVLQAGGYDDSGTLVLFEGDSLMTVGSTYLLVARRYRIDDQEAFRTSGQSGALCAYCFPTDLSVYHLIAPGFDHKPADTPQQRAALQSQYSNAHANQVDPVPLIED